MKLSSLPIEGLVLIEPKVFADERGYFFESFHKQKLEDFVGHQLTFVQDNESMSNTGVVRGLHFQKPPMAQGKLVRVTKGAVLDIVVDIRKSSPTYGQSVAVELNETNKHQLYVPPGFLHGFATLKDQTIFNYKCTEYYAPETEGSVLWNDKSLDLDWGVSQAIVSEKDRVGQTFSEFETPFE